MSKRIELNAPRTVIQKVVGAMCEYAQAAYPKGGSECAQSAHEALVSAALIMAKGYDEYRQCAFLSQRQRGITKTAIKYYAQQLAAEEGCVVTAREDCLLRLLEGEKISEAMYASAEQQDRSHG